MDPRAEDQTIEAAALRILLDEHPAMLTPSELALRLGATDRAGAEVVERGLRDLVAHGLAHRAGGLAVASQAAVRHDSLPLP